VAFPKIRLRRPLLLWYRKNARNLPWRKTRDPYAILISEFMLQQTRVATVLSYYSEWLRRFPDFATLARFEASVLHAWQGLGYYARARNLHAAAGIVVDRYGGDFPQAIARMRELPGIGRYTANAVATFAFDQSVPIVEANTARVLTRLFNFRRPIDCTAGREALWKHAAMLVPKRSAGIYNSALTDLGALVCLPRWPKCEICPVKKFCRAKNPETLPIKKARPQTRQLLETRSYR
jgi:A/G-specific adenine glycosylase